jgi:hypothetical protein
MASLNVAWTAVPGATPVAPIVGLVETTVGAEVSEEEPLDEASLAEVTIGAPPPEPPCPVAPPTGKLHPVAATTASSRNRAPDLTWFMNHSHRRRSAHRCIGKSLAQGDARIKPSPIAPIPAQFDGSTARNCASARQLGRLGGSRVRGGLARGV